MSVYMFLLLPSFSLPLFLPPGSFLLYISSCPQPSPDPPVDLAHFEDAVGVEGGEAALVGDPIEEGTEIEVDNVFIIFVFCSLSMVLHEHKQVCLAGSSLSEAVLAVINQSLSL